MSRGPAIGRVIGIGVVWEAILGVWCPSPATCPVQARAIQCRYLVPGCGVKGPRGCGKGRLRRARPAVFGRALEIPNCEDESGDDDGRGGAAERGCHKQLVAVAKGSD